MHAIALLPALLLATPTVDGARATLSDGRLAVEVSLSEPVLREEVRSKLEADRLSIYIEGAEASGKRSYGSASLALTVLPRTAYTKLELPITADMGCAGPVAIRVTDSGVRATLPCQARPAAAAAPPVAEARVEAKPEARAEAKTAPVAEPRPVVDLTAAPAAPAPAVAVTPALPAAAPALPADKAAGPLPARAPTGTVSSLPVMAMVAMVGLAVFLMWRKRKQHKNGLIHILETASLGPKRSLIVAEINGERLILGASEAGITLLNQMRPGGYDATAFPMSERTLASAPVAAIARAAEAAALARPAPAPAAAVSEGEGGLLAKLFRRRQDDRDDVDISDDGPSTMAHDFADLLNDSIEDEELRRRLQSGMTARTSGRTS
jgi:flagellar biogenesis protein FliO